MLTTHDEDGGSQGTNSSDYGRGANRNGDMVRASKTARPPGLPIIEAETLPFQRGSPNGATRGEFPTDASSSAVRLAIQPNPKETMITRATNIAGHFTAIRRDWHSMEDVNHCNLCPLALCQARRDNKPRCLIAVPDYIPDSACALFSRVDWIATEVRFATVGSLSAPSLNGLTAPT